MEEVEKREMREGWKRSLGGWRVEEEMKERWTGNTKVEEVMERMGVGIVVKRSQ